MAASTPIEKKPINDLLKEKDAFLTTSEKVYEYFLRHTKGFIAVGVAVVVIIVASALYLKFQESAELESCAAYEKAQALAENPETFKAAIAALEQVRTDYAGRKGARVAGYSLVKLYSGTEEPAKALALAENLLQTMPVDEISIKPLLLGTIGGLSESAGEWGKAAASYEAILGLNPTDPAFTRQVTMSLGRVYVASGQKEKAVECYEKIVKDSMQSDFTFMANKKLAELKEQPVAFPIKTQSVPGIDTDLPAGQAPAAATEDAAAPAEDAVSANDAAVVDDAAVGETAEDSGDSAAAGQDAAAGETAEDSGDSAAAGETAEEQAE